MGKGVEDSSLILCHKSSLCMGLLTLLDLRGLAGVDGIGGWMLGWLIGDHRHCAGIVV